MSGRLLDSVIERAIKLNVPIAAHFDLTYRCNERCVHCYLYHESPNELTTEEVFRVLQELSEAGTLFLIFSGGEFLLRRDALTIIAEARKLSFSVKLKTNGTLISEETAEALGKVGVQGVDISVYSADAAVHDSITKMPGSFRKSLDAIRGLQSVGIEVGISSVLMRDNQVSITTVKELALELGATYKLDPVVSPMIDGNASVVRHRADSSAMRKAFVDFNLAGRTDDNCLASENLDDAIPCSAGHSQVYIDPFGRVYPCVQFPVLCGDLRNQSFSEIWKTSPQLAQIRKTRISDLPLCRSCVHSTICSRCPGLALIEGDLYGPSSIDCIKSELRTGVKALTTINHT